jgi:hypothetical protein
VNPELLKPFRDRMKVVVLCQKVSHGRAFLSSLGWPLTRPLHAPAVPSFDWRGWWRYGHPPPLLIVDPLRRIHAEDVKGADLVVDVWLALREGGKIRHVIAMPVGKPAEGLLDRLRLGGMRDIWQPAEWQYKS